ncbi:segregation and condensation protein B [Rubritalea squalenifaciens DSM 18772]|uniref:Segregation and condensation protein B n=2 Tax=Rubritalea TaxID=361050 RepID=A0A1M6IFW2_9BACT|nr:SMC-Scp complex subunit ScpB [Rubritalea squalenifaciens]SHJ33321.1 segregation and condensation protein B [Rubritalea squalenifaciens DSM 18772]
MELTAILEALLIASEDPLPTHELARLVRARVAEADELIKVENEDAGDSCEHRTLDPSLASLATTSEEQVSEALASLNRFYDANHRAFVIIERAKGWKFYTKPEYADFVRQLFPGQKPQRLSGPAMETLAIIAYRQPITKAAMEAVRGVSCDGMIQKLLDRELVRIGGRADLPGRPLLYETTDLFYEHFGIKSIDDLPNAGELRTVKLPEPKSDEEDQSQPASDKEEATLELDGGTSVDQEGSNA